MAVRARQVRRPSARRPFQSAASDEVNVEMKYGLPGFRTDVEHGAVSVFDIAFTRDLRGDEVTTADEFRVFWSCFLQPPDVFLRHHQHMRRGLRVDVFEGEGVIVLVDFSRGDFVPDHAAEEAVGHGLHQDNGRGGGEETFAAKRDNCRAPLFKKLAHNLV
jgi:hypothetical protein